MAYNTHPGHELEFLAERLAREADGRSVFIVVDGASEGAHLVADELATALRLTGASCARLSDRSPLADEDAWRSEARPGMVVVADGPRWRANPPAGCWDAVVDAATGAVLDAGPQPPAT
jgi:hypothetical protein